MKVAVFSDLHDNIPNLNIFLSWVNKHKIPKLIFCGDLCNIDTLKYLSNNFSGDIFLVGGNADSFYASDVKKIKNLIYDKDKLEIKLDNQKILVVHKPADLKIILSENNNGYDFAFHGHTHKPWLINQDGLIIANPGTLSEIFSKSTFALLDTETGKLELKILESI